jgi:chromosome segregation protein
MKLRSLRVHGFKSFADSTTIDFHEGITAIVGPNGCGKSNISDAIRWVLGEQRPTAIRGAKMEEAIFQGSVHRRPVGRGSVAMVVSNEDGKLPIPYDEVEIGRTVYRDGGSDYSLNRSTVRLRDVHDLCRDTGLGTNAYAVIENRMIDSILSDRADERRGLFEEASGIGKYKDRRKAAMRRLEQAEADLQRLEDVIGEVETKVRSLARQRGKAERFKLLRERRLAVEVAVVRNDLSDLRQRMQELDAALSGDRKTGEGMIAELRTAEARYEALRLQEADLQRKRSEVATVLEGIREDLVRWERDLAVAGERRSAAERRLSQIGTERSEATERVERFAGELLEVEEERGSLEEGLQTARKALVEGQSKAGEVRARLEAARSDLDDSERMERDLARRGAQLEGDAAAADAQSAELERRVEQLQNQLEDASSTLTDLEAQGDLFSGRVTSLSSDLDEALALLDGAQSSLTGARERLEAARSEHASAAARLQRSSAEIEGLEALEEGGVEPVIEALVSERPDDVHGVLRDFIECTPELATVVERYLGSLTRALVVENREAVTRIGRWFEKRGKGGGLVLLPLDCVPRTEGSAGGLRDAVSAVGKGAPWVRALLAQADLVDDADLTGEVPSHDRVSRSGIVVDARGIFRIGDAVGGAGVLSRKERLRQLRDTLPDLQKLSGEADRVLEETEARFEAATASADEARKRFLKAEDDLRAVSAEAHAQVDRRSRLDTHRDDLVRQLEGTRATRARVVERAEQAREDRATLAAEEQLVQERRSAAVAMLEAVQEEWEAAREEESRLSVHLARIEGDVGRLDQRLGDLRRERDTAVARKAQLDTEESELHLETQTVAELEERGAEATERLFAARDAARLDFDERDEELRAVTQELRSAEASMREARDAERAASDRLHRLELERQEVGSRIALIQERLEGEWGRPLEHLLQEAEPVEGEPEDLKEELEQIVTNLERIGLVNMLAVEEHAEESARLEFLQEQQADLMQARNDLRTAIREINDTAIDLFESSFQQIRENFRETFVRLFEGGEADIWLADPEDPLESPIEIHASPRGKKTQRIDLLSGGERALTALSLLFGIYLVKPSPFCVFDEVDAPLDENNIGRFIRLLQEFKAHSQFVVITHNPRTIEAADWIYGVTMEEPGVSKIVGVSLSEAPIVSGSAA